MTLCPACEGSTLWEVYLYYEHEDDYYPRINIQCSNCSHVIANYQVRTDVGYLRDERSTK